MAVPNPRGLGWERGAIAPNSGFTLHNPTPSSPPIVAAAGSQWANQASGLHPLSGRTVA
ncbi:MAG: hypothetical protein VKJ09_07040 [Leptolyngbya sp.]|nr:hypothetical protein [Leptolyngbya sp.]